MPYRENEINEMYVKNILSFIKKGGLEGADDEINNYIGLAKYIWIDVKKTLTDKDAIRQKLLKRGRPLIDLSPKKWTQGMVRLLVLGLAILQTGHDL